jgi:ABC-2 type transport system permease protein
MSATFSLGRFAAIFTKEFVQMRRDRITFGMMIGVPLLQLVLFGFAINSDPKHLPAVLVMGEDSIFARSIVSTVEHTDYIRLAPAPVSAQEADRLLKTGDVQFAFTIPPHFSADLLRGRRPALVVEADATDPIATANAVSALNNIDRTALQHDLTGPLASLAPSQTPFELRLQRRYNEEGLSTYNVVPGLIGVVLTMTMIMMTGLAMTRERERGTMENLLAMPVRPIEVMLGKIVPFIFVGYIQVGIILLASRFMFDVPFEGSLLTLSIAAILFIAANLAVGFTFSTFAENQLQAMQLSIFFFLPSLLLSGFMFPFRGMPDWAQVVGQALPLTHFLRIIRGVLLKGNGWAEIWPEIWPIAAFMLAVSVLALLRYRKTLD